MKIKYLRIFGGLLALSSSIFMMILVGRTCAQQLSQQKRIERSADEHVERGLFLFKPHIIGGLSESLAFDLKGYSTKEERLKVSIEEFQNAIRKKRQLRIYKVAQVYAYLGDAWRDTGIELKKGAKDGTPSNPFRARSRKAFQNSLESFRLALENNPGDLKYTLTETYIEAFVYAEKLDEALSAIQRYERSNLTPDKGRDYGLIRLRADIQLMKGQPERAALTYEEWISKGNVHSKVVRGSDFYKKLESLFKLTGHPANLNLVH